MKYHLVKLIIRVVSPFGFVYGVIAVGLKAGSALGHRYVYRALDKKD